VGISVLPMNALGAVSLTVVAPRQRTKRCRLSGFEERIIHADQQSSGNGNEAVEQFRRRHSEISVVILDMSMPVMSGEETLSKLKTIDDSVPVLASSGYTLLEAQRRFGTGIAGFLQKPYTIQALSETVASLAKRSRRGPLSVMCGSARLHAKSA
jgi:CheY-like chemotaxis protein